MCSSTSASSTIADNIPQDMAALPEAQPQAAAREVACDGMPSDWARRATEENDTFLRQLFDACLQASESLPPAERLIMYDACDENDIAVALETGVRKRLDPRRNTKPKKPDDQMLVCTPFNPAAFNFTKIRNPGEVLLRIPEMPYQLLTNKFPLFKRHMLLVCTELVPQQMTLRHLTALTRLLQPTSFCAYFNSWCASASVNHFHCHVIDEMPPVTEHPLVPGPMVGGVLSLVPSGFPGTCYVFDATRLALLGMVVDAMQADNQPHNLLITPRLVYVFPKPLARPARSFELYPETVGGPELIGSFTLYDRTAFDRLSVADVSDLFQMNTASLPTHLLQPSSAHHGSQVEAAAEGSVGSTWECDSASTSVAA